MQLPNQKKTMWFRVLMLLCMGIHFISLEAIQHISSIQNSPTPSVLYEFVDDPAKGFHVDNVDKSTVPLVSENWNDLILAISHEDCAIFECESYGVERQGEVEAFSKPKDGMIVATPGQCMVHGFVSAVHLAYQNHYPLVITPDDIWLCIVQGFAAHVNRNAEELRHYFVEHESKEDITIRRDDFVKGSPANPWPEVFSKFSTEIRKYIGGETHDLLVPDFTTTGPVEKAAAEIVMMNAFQEYFNYYVRTACGIPEVQLKGTVDDWKQLREKAIGLGQFELEWWIEDLQPILDELVATAEGHVNKTFWSSIYKLDGRSGGPYITGWIMNLFPYAHRRVVTFIDDAGDYTFEFALKMDDIPTGISKVPFTWLYYEEKIKMNFYAGFISAVQDPDTLSVSSATGWIVSEAV